MVSSSGAMEFDNPLEEGVAVAADLKLDDGFTSPTFETEEEGEGRVSPSTFEVDGRVSPSNKKTQSFGSKDAHDKRVRLVQADYFDAFGGDMDDSDEEDMAAARIPSASCWQRCTTKLGNSTKLKKVKTMSHGIDHAKVTCCNKNGTSHNVYIMADGGDAYLAKRSCGMDSEHKFRRAIFRIIHSPTVERFILFCITLQSILLATSIPGNYMDYEALQNTFSRVNDILLGVYTIEFLMKVIALGLVNGKHAYLRSAWNMLDFLLVLSAWAFFVLETALDTTIINPSCLRVIRCLRQLRAAGFISHVRAALSYWAFLLNVVMVLLLTLVIFGVLGIQLFGGALSLQCANLGTAVTGDFDVEVYNSINNATLMVCPEALICTDNLCDFFEGDVPRWGYDNIFQALISGWVAATGDMWTVGMMTEITAKPLRYPETAWWFFTIAFVVLNMIINNLFVAVVVESFLESSRQETDSDTLKQSLMKLVAIFERLDRSRTGTIDTTELKTIGKSLGLTDRADPRQSLVNFD